MMKQLVGCLAACALLPNAAATAAESDAREGKFTFSVGAFDVLDYDSTALLTSRDFGAGLALSPEDVLGLDSRQTVLRLEGTWQIRPSHALTVSWHDISASNSLSIESEFDWVDKEGNEIVVPIGASVSSRLDYDIFKLGYLWRFYASEKVQLYAGAGLHMTDISLTLDAETTTSGVNTSGATSTVPLPVVSFALRYGVTPRFDWFVKTEAFKLSFDDWSGSYHDMMLGAEYRAWKRIGIGAVLASNSLRILEETPDTRFEFQNRINGVMLYLSGHF